MFDAIAPRYDLLNRLLSFGIDQWWRRRAVEMLREERPQRILDVATGTADLAIQAARSLDPETVVGVDLSEEMLRRGRRKVARQGLAEQITLLEGDALDLPFEDGSFDAALVAFGVRNFEELEAGLREISRVLRPGGTLIVLEFSWPRTPIIRTLYTLYARYVLPLVGRLISGDPEAYTYLPASARAFPDGIDFLHHLRAAGFTDLVWRSLTFGIAALYRGRLPAGANADGN